MVYVLTSLLGSDSRLIGATMATLEWVGPGIEWRFLGGRAGALGGRKHRWVILHITCCYVVAIYKPKYIQLGKFHNYFNWRLFHLL